MPWLMRKGTVFSALFAAVWLLFLPLSVLNVGTYEINERQVTGTYFLTHVDPWLVPLIAIFAAIAYGFWTERSWARHLPLAFWFGVDLVLLYEIVSGDAGSEAISYGVWAVIYLAVAWWYCYRKQSVVEYYKALEAARLGA